jgi:hypothetical protein
MPATAKDFDARGRGLTWIKAASLHLRKIEMGK